MRNFLIIRNKWMLLFILSFGCYVTDSTATTEIESQLAKNNQKIAIISNVIDSLSLTDQSDNLPQLNKKLLVLQEQIGRNAAYIVSLRDSIKAFQNTDLSSISSDQDIINSLIRIQSKLNIIEDKIFYSDSLYFNLLNDLVLMEAQIQDLNQNIENITNLKVSMKESEVQEVIDEVKDTSINTILDYKSSYDEAIELYMNKDYQNSLNSFRTLVESNSREKLADNSQFWIGQIYYLQKEYDLAIHEYKKVSSFGDGNKAPDADYKIALSYINLGKNDLALEHFNYIINQYPNNTDLVNKSLKFIEGNK